MPDPGYQLKRCTLDLPQVVLLLSYLADVVPLPWFSYNSLSVLCAPGQHIRLSNAKQDRKVVRLHRCSLVYYFEPPCSLATLTL